MANNDIKPALAESATRISEAMAAKGLRLVDVAQALGMPDKYGSSVHNWASGRNAPSPRYRAQLAKMLDIPEHELLPEGWDQQQGGHWMRMPDDSTVRKRKADREYQRRRRQAKVNGPMQGPAETALRAFKGDRQTMQDRSPPSASDVLSTSLRADGTMRLKLD